MNTQEAGSTNEKKRHLPGSCRATLTVGGALGRNARNLIILLFFVLIARLVLPLRRARALWRVLRVLSLLVLQTLAVARGCVELVALLAVHRGRVGIVRGYFLGAAVDVVAGVAALRAGPAGALVGLVVAALGLLHGSLEAVAVAADPAVGLLPRSWLLVSRWVALVLRQGLSAHAGATTRSSVDTAVAGRRLLVVIVVGVTIRRVLGGTHQGTFVVIAIRVSRAGRLLPTSAGVILVTSTFGGPVVRVVVIDVAFHVIRSFAEVFATVISFAKLISHRVRLVVIKNLLASVCTFLTVRIPTQMISTQN